jgi:predicted ATPase/GAF domain-containing protein/tRNA A-37 threonylcarbamoyl transferase component Bud32
MQSALASGPWNPLEGYVSSLMIHEGAETLVFRARAAETGAPVIIKLTKNEYPTARELARLRREFAILRDIETPRTPRARSLEERGRGVALVMDDLGHGTLRDLLDRGPLDIETTLTIAISLSDVLAEVHRRGVIHKDITPRNIVVDEATKDVYLIDFGISARLAEEMHLPGGPSGLEGTLVYIAPEQTGRMNRAVDLRADLYSLGAVLYEMLTDTLPFPADDAAELIHSHLARSAASPHERESSVPVTLSAIVMTLLAKTPEDRYQSDAGLRADLEECLTQLREKGRIDPFPLRRRDKATELRRPQRLYGRERDLEVLADAFERARLRGPELVLVSGYSGIGKSALVNEMHKLTAREGGYFVSGKFDHISREMPLAPVMHAFRDLILQVLTEPPQSLAQWKADLLHALGGNGRLLTDLVPELELIIGPQPEPPALSPNQAKNRFEMTLQNFLDVFADPDHPLVIFLDDLQWIDPASLSLLKLLLVDAYSQHMVIIGAYRENEVGPGHPLALTLDELRRRGRSSTDIHLRPLDQPTVQKLVADTLTSSEAEVAELAASIHEKTQGNPFFVYQFMVALKDEGLLCFDAAAGEWRWEIERVRTANVTDNVVDLMVSKLQRLSSSTRQALTLAACIGSSFDLRTLSIIGEKAITEMAAALWQAMREGYVIPLDGDYRLLEDGAATSELPADFNVRYRFIHDRILHAAYMLVDPERKRRLHLSIGRLLRRRAGNELRDEDLLEIVRHLNPGAEGIDDPAERLDLARLNLRAGRRARAATAWRAAADYFRAGLSLLRDSDWETDFELCFSLHVEGAESEYLADDIERAKALFESVLPRTRSELERATICRVRMRILFSLGRFPEAVKVGGEGLVSLGYPWNPEEAESQAVFMAELAQVEENLGGRRIEELLDAPEITDPKLRATLELFDVMGITAYQLGSNAFGVITLKAVNLALKHGNTDVCAFPFSSLGYVLALLFGRVADGLAFAKLALDLNKKYPNAMQISRINICYACCIPMKGTLRDAEPYLNIARQAGLESGDLSMLGVACYLAPIMKLGAGDQIEDVLEVAEKDLALVRRTREAVWIASVVLVRQTAACLAGRTHGRTSLSDDSINEDTLMGSLNDVEHGNSTFHYHYLKLVLHSLYRETAAAVASGEAAEARAMYVGGNPQTKLMSFYLCMTNLALPPAASPEEVERRAQVMARHRGALDSYAASSPKSFLHMKVLVDAEAARAGGEFEQAARFYENAITLSQENKAPHIEALANELCARFYMGLGATKAAGVYMKDAYRAYIHWGAMAKAEALETEYAYVMPSLGRDKGSGKRTTTTTSTDITSTSSNLLTRTSLGSLRDAALVVRAAQAIAGEVDLPKVIDRLASLVLENAGAQRGALILSRDGELVLTAIFGDASSAVEEGHGRPLSEGDNIPESIVLYVARTQDPLVLDDSGAVMRFSEDAYIAKGAPKSILCLPLLHQSRLSGVLYLENRVMTGVFNAARVELLALLSAQAAIAIENARLISNVRAANAEVQRSNERLEVEVAHRTEELGRANKDLLAAKERLERELERREQIEQERTTLQEQVIRAQRARLAEMSTPVIPITDEIIVMPLIGTVDRERAQQVLAAALEGVQRHRAQVLILDITGIKQIDTNVAGTLLGVSGALRLLGAEAVLTGIAPEIATTLVGLGIDLASFMTKGTLQSGMDYALRRVRSSGMARGRSSR